MLNESEQMALTTLILIGNAAETMQSDPLPIQTEFSFELKELTVAPIVAGPLDDSSVHPIHDLDHAKLV